MIQSEEIAALTRELAELKAQLEAVSARAQRTDDYFAINNLQRSYGDCVDEGQWDRAAALFAEDGALEIVGRGSYAGRAGVREYLGRFPKDDHDQLFSHMALQPVITIAADGRSATGRWRAAMYTPGRGAPWGEATYEMQYVKRGGAWQIGRLVAFITSFSDRHAGLDRIDIPLLRSFEVPDPDAPPA